MCECPRVQLDDGKTYLEFDDDTSTVSLHLPKSRDDGKLMSVAAMLLFALNDDDCRDLLEEIYAILDGKMGD